MQTTPSDIRAGWRTFRAWEKRFDRSQATQSDDPKYKIYLADFDEVPCIWEMGDIRDEAVTAKIAFMRAYLCMMAIDTREFNRTVKKLLRMQGRLAAPHLLGFWINQMDPGKFRGGDLGFYGFRASIFCEDVRQVDFADITSFLPFDQIVVRKPKGNWHTREVQKLAKHISWDLAFDGMETDIESSCSGEFAYLRLLTPDYGIGP